MTLARTKVVARCSLPAALLMLCVCATMSGTARAQVCGGSTSRCIDRQLVPGQPGSVNLAETCFYDCSGVKIGPCTIKCGGDPTGACGEAFCDDSAPVSSTCAGCAGWPCTLVRQGRRGLALSLVPAEKGARPASRRSMGRRCRLAPSGASAASQRVPRPAKGWTSTATECSITLLPTPGAHLPPRCVFVDSRRVRPTATSPAWAGRSARRKSAMESTTTATAPSTTIAPIRTSREVVAAAAAPQVAAEADSHASITRGSQSA